MGTVRFGTELDSADFDILASQPLSWLEAAEMNRRAARLVGGAAIGDIATMTEYGVAIANSPQAEKRTRIQRPDDTNLDGPTFFLYALALENLLKGVLVAREPLLMKGGTLGKDFSHDLVKQAERAAITTDEAERKLLEFVGSCGTSWGRYPIAAKFQGTTIGRNHSYNLQDVIDWLERLYLRFAEALIRATYPSGKTFNIDPFGEMTLDEIICLNIYREPPIRP
jgi:hypothetical protein